MRIWLGAECWDKAPNQYSEADYEALHVITNNRNPG